jgi:hypothetical protein
MPVVSAESRVCVDSRLPLDIEYTLDPLKGPLTGERASVVDFAPICVAEVLVHAGRKERQTMEKIVERFEEVFSVGALTHESNRSVRDAQPHNAKRVCPPL